MSFIGNSQCSPPSAGMASKNIFRYQGESTIEAEAGPGLCHDANVSVPGTQCPYIEEEE